ncbi:chitooligosaccharide deacetylase [Pseudofrankia asymbiotica]|uniref:Chitooligosaccharide deacetylase n=1 Tax=Pseudofrankia asymbiotica TaxID=1834516 RepID=A0A1V2I3F1_9ACTN|nr:chitooligosaccharide deacetylase [Pseudofrankia asymbiotica]
MRDRSPKAARDGTRRGVRSRLMPWIVAGAVGLASAGLVESAQPALAAGTATAVPTSTATTAPTPTPTAAPVPTQRTTSLSVRQQPAYTVHQILPNAPANAVALTIDDGPDPTWTPRVLALLRQYNVHATFCLVGRQAQAHPDLVRQIVAAGHAICNHSMTHPQPFAHRPAAEVQQQISRAQSAITSAAGTAPHLFRAPGGDWSPTVFEAAAKQGLAPIAWNVDPRDWSRPGTQKIVDSLLAAKPGDILLCHDGDGDRPDNAGTDRSQTVQALRTALPQLKSKGYTFVTL